MPLIRARIPGIPLRPERTTVSPFHRHSKLILKHRGSHAKKPQTEGNEHSRTAKPNGARDESIEPRKDRIPGSHHSGLFGTLLNRSLGKWLLGCAISPYICTLSFLLCGSSVFNSFRTNF
jgi:hypothetical protein